jgi:membrane-associated protease RseP (regulator of RpoE activity)
MTITDHNLTELDTLIGQLFQIEDITYGGPKQPFVVRYRGLLISKDSAIGFGKIAEALSSHNLVPMLRSEEGCQVLYLIQEPEAKGKLNPRLNLVLFILTLISVLFTGGLYGTEGNLPSGTWQAIATLIKNGWAFAVSLLAILGAHEFGHYFAGRKNGVKVTLPFFIPFPLSMFGTMGAFINMRSVPKNRRALFDLAVTGPLCGLAVSIVVLFIGLSLSKLNQLPLAIPAGGGYQMEGNSLLYLLLKFISFGKLLPEPQAISGLPLLPYWVRYFFTGLPFPWGATDVMLHPVAWAGWAGLLITGINLIPAGQLDGGHIFYTVMGKQAADRAFPFIVGLLAALGIFWNGWWLWAALIFFFGRRHAEPLDQITELDGKRKFVGFLALIVFVLVFVPVPLTLIGA